MNKNFIIIQGSIKRIKFYQSTDDATEVTLVMKNNETLSITSFTESYVNGEAIIELSGSDTSIYGEYSYQINETVTGGLIKYGVTDCNGECEYGIITICESLDVMVS